MSGVIIEWQKQDSAILWGYDPLPKLWGQIMNTLLQYQDYIIASWNSAIVQYR